MPPETTVPPIDAYHPSAPFYDELFEPDGVPRRAARRSSRSWSGSAQTHWRRPAAGATRSSCSRGSRSRRRRRATAPARATGRSRSTSCRASSRRRVATIKRGLAQRIRALNHFVDDVYHGREIVREGIVPWPLVVSRSHFARAVHGIRPPGGVYCHVSGCDLVRDGDGPWKVLEDNVRTPSGISYVLENRVAMTRLRAGAVRRPPRAAGRPLPAAAARGAARRRAGRRRRGDRRRVDAGPAELGVLRARVPGAPDGRRAGRGVGPGRARRRRSTCARRAGSRACTRSTAASTTTSSTRWSSVPTRCSACRGSCAPTAPARVAIANAFGTGVADDKAIYHYVPEMIRFYLGEEPILDNVPTYLLRRPRARGGAGAAVGELVVKPTGESGGKGVFIGPHATEAGARRRSPT